MCDTYKSVYDIFIALLSSGQEFSTKIRADIAMKIYKKYVKLADSTIDDEIRANLEKFTMNSGLDNVIIDKHTVNAGQVCRENLVKLWDTGDETVRNLIEDAFNSLTEQLKNPIDILKMVDLDNPAFHKDGAVINLEKLATARTTFLKTPKKTVGSTPDNTESILEDLMSSRQTVIDLPVQLNSTDAVFADKLKKIEKKFHQTLTVYAKKEDLQNLANFDYVNAKIESVTDCAVEAAKKETIVQTLKIKKEILEAVKKDIDYAGSEAAQEKLRKVIMDKCRQEMLEKDEFTLEERIGMAQVDYKQYLDYKNAIYLAKGKGQAQLVIADNTLWKCNANNDQEFLMQIPEIKRRLGVERFEQIPGKRSRISKTKNLIIFAKIGGRSSSFQSNLRFISDLIENRYNIDRIYVSLLMPEEYDCTLVFARWRTELKIISKFVIKPQGFYILVINDGTENSAKNDDNATTLTVKNPMQLVQLKNPSIEILQTLAKDTHFVFKGILVERPTEFSKVKRFNNRVDGKLAFPDAKFNNKQQSGAEQVERTDDVSGDKAEDKVSEVGNEPITENNIDVDQINVDQSNGIPMDSGSPNKAQSLEHDGGNFSTWKTQQPITNSRGNNNYQQQNKPRYQQRNLHENRNNNEPRYKDVRQNGNNVWRGNYNRNESRNEERGSNWNQTQNSGYRQSGNHEFNQQSNLYNNQANNHPSQQQKGFGEFTKAYGHHNAMNRNQRYREEKFGNKNRSHDSGAESTWSEWQKKEEAKERLQNRNDEFTAF